LSCLLTPPLQHLIHHTMRKSVHLDALQNSAMVQNMENEEIHPLQRAKSDMVRPITRRTHRRGSNSDGDGSEMLVPTKIIPLSDHTIRLIEAMDEGQVENALTAFEEMKTKRRESNLVTSTRASRRKSKGFDLCDFDVVVDGDEARKTDDVFFQSNDLKNFPDSNKPAAINAVKSESEADPNFTAETALKRRPPRERRQALHRSLVSTERNGFDVRCQAHSDGLEKKNCSAEESSPGLQAFLGKITGAFHHQDKPKKQLDGPALFRKGKRKADRCLFLEAVALFNFALEKQRETLGEDHLDCATTLNEIGNAWMILGERYSALTAYEEALYIRQKGLGPGALEVAETTNNIWMILHEQRCEMEEEMNEGNDEYSA